MTGDEEFDFISSLTALFELFDRKPSNQLVELYWQALSGLTILQFTGACGKAAQSCKFMPKPSELLELAGVGGKLDLTARKAQAWEAVETAMRVHDYTTPVDFGPLVNACVRNLGGWVRLCARSVPDLVWERKRFEELYEAFASKPIDSLHGAPLPGSFPGTPVRIAIGGVMPPLQVEAKKNEVQADMAKVVRELADGKAST